MISENKLFIISTSVYPWTNKIGLFRNYRGEQETAEAELAFKTLKRNARGRKAYPKVAKISQRTTLAFQRL